MRAAARTALLGLLGLPLGSAVVPAQAPVDPSTWTPQSYPTVAGFGAGVWTVATDGASVGQSVNGQPMLFASDFAAQGTEE